MNKTQAATLVAILGSALLFEAIEPHRAVAAAQTTPASLPFAGTAVALPGLQEPFDTRPITPVESAGAPMYDSP